LNNIRKGVFPEFFEKSHQVEYEIMKKLLTQNPSERPSTTELLRGNLLPSKMEEEILKEALNTITNPTTTIFSNLMERLFQLPPDKHLDYSYDYHSV
jgi:translation initiation factor 2-alpha kinase 4